MNLFPIEPTAVQAGGGSVHLEVPRAGRDTYYKDASAPRSKRPSARLRRDEDRSLIRYWLACDDQFVYDALRLLYTHQTPFEQRLEWTCDANGEGFDRADVKRLGRLAKKVLGGRRLTEEELKLCYRRLPRYWRQVLKAVTPNEGRHLEIHRHLASVRWTQCATLLSK
jgi:hypothetical protein